MLNKVDLVHPKERLLASIASMQKRHEFVEIFPVSAKKKSDVAMLLKAIPSHLEVSPPLFPADMSTDRGPEFFAAELIREKLTNALQQELPYGLTVQIEKYQRSETGVSVYAVVWVERDSQKGMVVGKGGRLLKQIGTQARRRVDVTLHRVVHCADEVLLVEVRQDLLRLGFESP